MHESSAPPPIHPGTPTPGRDPEVSRLILGECFELWRQRLVDIARTSLDLAGDLFEGNDQVSENDVEAFRAKRSEWIVNFDRTIRELYERRMSGVRRKGRRPDFDASLATLRVLTAFDQEKQAALTAAAAFLVRHTARETAALDLRVDELMPDANKRDVDNPFAPEYILDAVGVASRGAYPNPRVWRPVMERVVADLTPAANKLYITLNRHLADRGVLPEIKALLRARSEHRPAEDKDLLPTFGRMIGEAAPALGAAVDVPPVAADAGGPPVLDFDRLAKSAIEPVAALLPSALAAPAGTGAAVMPAPAVLSGLSELAARAEAAKPARATGPDGDFPDLDPLMALGAQTPLFNTLGSFQRIDLPEEIARVAAQGDGSHAGAVVPWNLIPHIRAAITAQIGNPSDRITMDVIALVFDYIFRDRSIPDEERRLFQRLQVPVVKAALLDRSFFSDARHPARRLLDHLAECAIAATQDAAYRAALDAEAQSVIDEVCSTFEVDVAVFERADERVLGFMEAERHSSDRDARPEVDRALAAEEGDVDGTAVRTHVRDRLAGIELPFEVRSFVDTVWCDYMSGVRRAKGEGSTEWVAATHTLDDLLWSISAHERASQKARLTRMIPALIAGLRKAVVAQNVAAERAKPFFDLIYGLHMAAIKGRAGQPPADAAHAGAPAAANEPTIRGTRAAPAAQSVHDFASEMIVGTWLAFAGDDGRAEQARLSWVSPRRTKYLFTSRTRQRAFMLTPEELAWQLGTGRATLVLEPVPLFDRAVSAALDTLAAHKPAAPAPNAGPRAA